MLKSKRPLALFFASIGLTFGLLMTQGGMVSTAQGTMGTEQAFQACDDAFANDSTACQMNPEYDSQAVYDYNNCLFAIREEPDFCAIARDRAYQCQYTYDPLTDFIGYMNCTTASGVQYCE
jgi:hypothetical protein